MSKKNDGQYKDFVPYDKCNKREKKRQDNQKRNTIVLLLHFFYAERVKFGLIIPIILIFQIYIINMNKRITIDQ